MRSKTGSIVSSRQVQELAEAWLSEALTLKGTKRKCTTSVLWKIVLFAASRMWSLFAACRDLSEAPSDEAVRKALRRSLPKRAVTLEEWMQPALAGQHLPKALFRRKRELAIDWHLIPYHGEPRFRDNELYHSQPKSGTTKFHAYATLCVVEQGHRYTLAVTSVRGKEPLVAVLKRLFARLQKLGLGARVVLLDRQFFTAEVVVHLQSIQMPFVIPLMLRGRKAKPGKKARGKDAPVKLRDFQKRSAGRYGFTWQVKGTPVFDVVVAYKSFHHHRTKKRRNKKFLYAVWRVSGDTIRIRELYRRRFGIETSYRQLGQARIRTCTTDPVLRLFFVLVSLVLRNAWVWLHFTYFSVRNGSHIKVNLHCLRYKRMLDWIARRIIALLDEDTELSTQLQTK